MSKTKTGALLAGALFSAMVAVALMLCAPHSAWAAEESEPNDSFAQANTISLGTNMYGLSMPSTPDGWVTHEGPGDYYKVYIPVTGQYKITFVNETYEDIPAWSTNLRMKIYNQYYEYMDSIYVDYNTTKPASKEFMLTKGNAYLCVEDGWLTQMQVHQYRLKIQPVINKTSITKVTAGKKAATVKFKKMIGTSKYEVRYSTKSSMKGAKTVTVKASKNSVKIKKLKKGKKYYFQVRVAKNMAGKTFYSGWSGKKSVRITK